MKRTTVSKVLVFLLALLLTLSLAGCGASGSKNGYDYDSAETPPQSAAEAGDYAESTDNALSPDEIAQTSRKLIYNAHISAETKEFDKAKDELDGLITEFGAYIQASDISGQGYEESRQRRYLDYTIRVPAESLQGFMSRMEEIVNVVSNSMDMDDVTGAYIDAEARRNSLEKEEERLLELLEQAATVDEVLMIEDRLSNVRYEIESLASQLKTYDNEVAYSTVYFSLRDVTEYTSGTSFGARMGEAFSGGWDSFVNVVQNLLIALIWMLPFLLICAVVVLVIVLCVKRSNKKRRARFPAPMGVQPPAVPPVDPKDPPEQS